MLNEGKHHQFSELGCETRSTPQKTSRNNLLERLACGRFNMSSFQAVSGTHFGPLAIIFIVIVPCSLETWKLVLGSTRLTTVHSFHVHDPSHFTWAVPTSTLRPPAQPGLFRYVLTLAWVALRPSRRPCRAAPAAAAAPSPRLRPREARCAGEEARCARKGSARLPEDKVGDESQRLWAGERDKAMGQTENGY